MSSLNILVIATGYPSKLLDTIKKRGHTYTLAKPGDFDLYLSDNPKGFDKVYLYGGRLVASKYDAMPLLLALVSIGHLLQPSSDNCNTIWECFVFNRVQPSKLVPTNSSPHKSSAKSI